MTSAFLELITNGVGVIVTTSGRSPESNGNREQPWQKSDSSEPVSTARASAVGCAKSKTTPCLIEDEEPHARAVHSLPFLEPRTQEQPVEKRVLVFRHVPGTRRHDKAPYRQSGSRWAKDLARSPPGTLGRPSQPQVAVDV